MENTETLFNGINRDSSKFHQPDHPVTKTTSETTVDDLNLRIEFLEEQNSNSEAKIVELEAEIETLRRKNKSSESDRKAAEAIAKRAAEFEGQVVRLEHDFISAMNEGEEVNRENRELKANIGELEEKAKERENMISELRREKLVVEGSANELQARLKVSEDKVKKMEELMEKAEESDKLIGGLMEKIRERDEILDDEKKRNEKDDGFKGLLKKPLPVIGAVSAGGCVLVAMAACYFRHNRN